MKRVDGRISILLAAESLPIPQISTHIFEYGKKEASARTHISTYGFKPDFQVPDDFASGITDISQSYVTPLWELYKEPEAKARWTWLYGTLPIRHLTSVECGSDKFTSPPHLSGGCMLSWLKGYSLWCTEAWWRRPEPWTMIVVAMVAG